MHEGGKCNRMIPGLEVWLRARYIPVDPGFARGGDKSCG